LHLLGFQDDAMGVYGERVGTYSLSVMPDWCLKTLDHRAFKDRLVRAWLKDDIKPQVPMHS
jgi:hypothetical protein